MGPTTQRQAGLEAALEHGAARTRRYCGIGPWRPEAETGRTAAAAKQRGAQILL